MLVWECSLCPEEGSRRAGRCGLALSASKSPRGSRLSCWLLKERGGAPRLPIGLVVVLHPTPPCRLSKGSQGGQLRARPRSPTVAEAHSGQTPSERRKGDPPARAQAQAAAEVGSGGAGGAGAPVCFSGRRGWWAPLMDEISWHLSSADAYRAVRDGPSHPWHRVGETHFANGLMCHCFWSVSLATEHHATWLRARSHRGLITY